MSRRSRSRRQSGLRLPLIALVVLLLAGAGAWWWSQRDAAPEAVPAVAEREAGDPQRLSGVLLPLPPVEDTRPTESAPTNEAARDSLPAFLPAEARHTLRLIRQGGPFPHRQDGSVFGNREGRLPRQPNGYYREYTVETPGLDHRGARRIVTGGQPPREYYYTDDHYESFRRFETGPTGATP
ncbi:ribonuclease domain-containing protein [Pseudoxanthomonas putridarboris]|uniref:Ribonuclease domain-containing protein n=1 Tax=Pseudoxanthomonas putridarboris TaxID=752605 RepID=A0ABU9J096_9GAMM